MDRLKDQIANLYGTLSGRQKAAIAGVLVLTLAAMGFVRWQTATDFKALYTALSPEDGAAVVERLKQSGIEYKLSDDGTAILVPSEIVPEARLQMAEAGLPKTGRIGFELFDQTNLGITEFAEHINYRRALEGELERSIMSLGSVERSRVHLTFAKDSVFTESRQPAKASVLLKLRPGRKLEPKNVLAVGHLVAAAVEGLAPEAVSILDMDGNLLSRPNNGKDLNGAEASDALVRYRQTLENGYVQKVEAALSPLLGPGKFHAGVSVECSFTSGEQTEEILNPEQSVIVSQQRTEEGIAGAGASGTPGTSATLPRPRTDIVASGTGSARMTESTQYQTARTVRHTRIPGGVLEKISTAVLVDHAVHWEGEGDQRKRVVAPRSPEELESIKQIVAAAIGFNAERGDQLTVESLPFQMTQDPPDLGDEVAGDAVPANVIERLKSDPALMAAAAGAVIVLLLVLAFGAKKLFGTKKSVPQVRSPAVLPESASEEEPAPALLALQGAQAYRAQSEQHLLIERAHEAISADVDMSAGVIHEWLLQEQD